jgi:hypothetical protein
LFTVPEILYTVTATLPDEATAREYAEWLLSGHVQAVVRHGAAWASVARVTDPALPIRVESRYVFPDQGTMDRYLREAAPALRAEGLQRFPPERGITFERRFAVMLGPSSA